MSKKIMGVTVGTPISPAGMERKMKPVKTVNGIGADENGNVLIEQPKMELIHSVTVPEEGLSAITLKDLKLDAVTLVVNSPATSTRGSARLQASYNGTVFMDTGAVNATDNGGRVFSLSQEFWKRNGQWQMQFVYQVTGWGMSVYTNTQGKVILESTYPYITGLQVTLATMVVGAKIDIYGVKRNEN